MYNENESIASYVDKPQTVSGGGESPKQNPQQQRVARTMAIIASIVVVLAGVKLASSIVAPVLLALFIAIILLIPLRWLQQAGCPAFLSYFIVLGCSLALLASLSYFVVISMNDFTGKILKYKDTFSQKYTQLVSTLKNYGVDISKISRESSETEKEEAKQSEMKTAALLSAETQQTGVDNPPGKTEENSEKPTAPEKTAKKDGENEEPTAINPITYLLQPAVNEDTPAANPEDVEEWVHKVQSEKQQSLLVIDPEKVLAGITGLIFHLRDFIESGFLVVVFSIFFLFEASQFSAKVDVAFGKEGVINNRHFHQIAQDVRHYLVLKSIINVASGGAAMFVYCMFDVPAWFFWGVLAYFLYFIPNIGGTLAAVIPGLLIFANWGLFGVLLYAVCLVAIECTIAYGFEPRFLGHGLGLSTVVILLTLVLWGWILGPIGLFLAAPLTVMLKIILQAFPETKWLAIMLGDFRDRRKV
ncbi:hypothetical protein FACS189419_02440 [Planctomycetales bacterium]|nr:hypothetical protein FACS189419_02440 [Planctomycetales bacterium]